MVRLGGSEFEAAFGGGELIEAARFGGGEAKRFGGAEAERAAFGGAELEQGLSL